MRSGKVAAEHASAIVKLRTYNMINTVLHIATILIINDSRGGKPILRQGLTDRVIRTIRKAKLFIVIELRWCQSHTTIDRWRPGLTFWQE